MKLKKIMESMESESKFNKKGFSDNTPSLSSKEKSTLLEKVKQYNEYGKRLKIQDSLVEISETLDEISKLAETYACNKQTSEWFSNEIVKEDFKRARNISESFKKIARECYGKLQRLNALYDDMGNILGRYYEISDSIPEVTPNTDNMKSQRGLPNADPTAVVEVKPNPANVKSQRDLPQLKDSSVEEVTTNDKNVKSQRNLPTGGPAIPQIKEVAPEGWEKTIKGMKKHPKIDNPWALAYWMKNKGYKPNKEESINEVKPNTSNIKSQRELPQGQSGKCGCLPKPENPSIKTTPAGSGDVNIKGSRNEPQNGPSSTQIKEVNPNTSDLKSQRRLPSLGDILNQLKIKGN